MSHWQPDRQRAEAKYPIRKEVMKVIRKHTSLPLVKHNYRLISSIQNPSDPFKHMLTHVHKLQLLLASHVCGCFLYFSLECDKTHFKKKSHK